MADPVNLVACVLVYMASLCATDTNLKVETWGSFPTRGIRMSASGWTASAFDGTDVIETLHPKALTEACSGDACLRYYARCEESRGAPKCQFLLERQGYQPLDLEVTADEPTALRTALFNLAFLAPDGTRFRLSDLSVRSDRRSPYCQRTGRRDEEGYPIMEPGCEAASGR